MREKRTVRLRTKLIVKCPHCKWKRTYYRPDHQMGHNMTLEGRAKLGLRQHVRVIHKKELEK